VLAHGFTQTGASWARIAGDLEADHEVVALDLPGHGRSPVPADGTGLGQAASAIASAGAKANYVGYSLGGRCVLHVALEMPALVERLVIVGAHPGICDQAERQRRRHDDEILATRLERGGDAYVPEFIDKWLAGPLFAHLSCEQADRSSRLGNTAAGLAASLRTAGTGSQLPLWEQLARLEMPVLVVAGQYDEKFSALARSSVAAIGDNASLAIVAGCGHAVCFERPREFAALLREFLGTAG
jgi:2-succinyl-6-hydroxy-2,4-cyclohexadiene-1-carboxylate synthase